MRRGTVNPVAELPPLRGIDVEPVLLGDGEPGRCARLVVRPRLAGDRAAEQDNLVLLAGLAVGGVKDHVARIGVDERAGEFPVDLRDALFVYNMTKLLI